MQPAPPRCPRCDAPAERGQRLCLHCGARLGEREAGTLARPGARAVAAAIVLLLAAAAGTAIALGAWHARRNSGPSLVAASLATTARTATAAASSSAGPTITTGTLPVAPGSPSTATATAPARPPAPRTAGILTWPHSRSGYTDVLLSLPESSGRAAVVRRARDARREGLPAVGVLLSSRHSTLRAGYWVVFSGRYRTSIAAQAALPLARSRGFPGAYPARVAP